jgi:hypothetical protein
MQENTERQSRRSREAHQTDPRGGAGVRERDARRAVEERNAAVRRWIDDDTDENDDPACRGID